MKYIIATILMILPVNDSIAQTKLGLKLTSSIISQRVSYQNDSVNISNGGNSLVPAALLFIEIPLSRNYFFSSGIGYISKRINLESETSSENASTSKKYNIQYMQLPTTIKLYTNEFALDKRLYFQFGTVFDIALHTKEKNSSLEIVDQFNPIDITLLFGGGVEIQLAPNTAMQIGLSYGRGLINVVKNINFPGDLFVNNDLYSIEIAVKF